MKKEPLFCPKCGGMKCFERITRDDGNVVFVCLTPECGWDSEADELFGEFGDENENEEIIF